MSHDAFQASNALNLYHLQFKVQSVCFIHKCLLKAVASLCSATPFIHLKRARGHFPVNGLVLAVFWEKFSSTCNNWVWRVHVCWCPGTRPAHPSALLDERQTSAGEDWPHIHLDTHKETFIYLNCVAEQFRKCDCEFSVEELAHLLRQQVNVLFVSTLRRVVQLYESQGLQGEHTLLLTDVRWRLGVTQSPVFMPELWLLRTGRTKAQWSSSDSASDPNKIKVKFKQKEIKIMK